jgi:hypothetical protein
VALFWSLEALEANPDPCCGDPEPAGFPSMHIIARLKRQHRILNVTDVIDADTGTGTDRYHVATRTHPDSCLLPAVTATALKNPATQPSRRSVMERFLVPGNSPRTALEGLKVW